MRNNFTANSALICLSVLILIGCRKETIVPNGNQITQIRNVSGFNAINLSGALEAHITYGSNFKVEIAGSENLVAKFISKLEKNELILKYDNNVNVNFDDIKIHITMPKVISMKSKGSASVEILGDFPSQDFFSAGIDGSGDILFKGLLNVNNLNAQISGSGNCDLDKIIAKSANFKIYGSGNMESSVTDNLDVEISGSGNVYYLGNPTLKTNYSGSGRAIKK